MGIDTKEDIRLSSPLNHCKNNVLFFGVGVNVGGGLAEKSRRGRGNGVYMKRTKIHYINVWSCPKQLVSSGRSY